VTTGQRAYAGRVREAASVALGIVLFATATTASAEVYKCVDAQGRATYQQQPCDAKSAAQSTLSGPAPAARAPVAQTPPAEPRGPAVTARSEPSANVSERDLAILLLAKASCDEHLPGFTERVKDDYARFRLRFREQVERVEGDEGYQQTLKQQKLKEALAPGRAAPPPAMDPEARKYAEALCYEQVLGTMVGRR
jgi:hypothetical protein